MSSRPVVLITGASGNIGSEVLKLLSPEKFQLIAGVHPDEPLPKDLKCSQVELDYDISDSVQKAFDQHIDYLFLIPSQSDERALQAKRLIAVAIERDIKFIVLISLLDCHSRGGAVAAQFRYIETVAPLQQNFMLMKKDFQGEIAAVSIPIGMGAFAPINAKDIAAVSKRILEDPFKYGGSTFRLTGPENLTGVQIAGKASRGLNKPVRFTNKLSLQSSDRFLDVELYSLISKGFFRTVSDDVFRLTGSKGISIESFFREHRDHFNGREAAKL